MFTVKRQFPVDVVLRCWEKTNKRKQQQQLQQQQQEQQQQNNSNKTMNYETLLIVKFHWI